MGTLATALTSCIRKTSPPLATPQPETMSNPEVVRNTQITITIGDNTLRYIGTGGLELHENAVAMGTGRSFSQPVYKVVDGTAEGPIPNIKFVYSNPDVCGYNVEYGSYKLPTRPLGGIFKRLEDEGVDTLVSGILTVFEMGDDSELTSRTYLEEFHILSDSVFQTNAVRLGNATEILPDGSSVRVGRLTVFLSQGKSTGTVAYLYETNEPSISR